MENEKGSEKENATGCNLIAIVLVLLFSAGVLYFFRSFIYSGVAEPVKLDLKDYDKFYQEHSFFTPRKVVLSASKITRLNIGEFAKPKGSSSEFKGYHVNSYYALEDSGVIVFMKPEKGSNIWTDTYRTREQITFEGVLEEPDDELTALIDRELFVKSKRMLLNCGSSGARTFFAWLILVVISLVNLSFFQIMIRDLIASRKKKGV